MGIITTYEYTGAPQAVVLEPGIYTITLKGAQGGSYPNQGIRGGYGAIVIAKIVLTKSWTFWFCVGGQPIHNSSRQEGWKALFGGGGSCAQTMCRAGGGSTDIRLQRDNIYSRLLVAGAGGGACSSAGGASASTGGDAGFNGGSGSGQHAGRGGSQTSPGTPNRGQFYGANNGRFYNGGYNSGWNNEAMGAGGAGWYGGASAGGDFNNGSGGAGSSFVWCQQWMSSTANVRSNPNFNLTEELWFSEPTFATGNTGNGQIIVELTFSRTFLIGDVNIKHYIDNKWKEI